MVIWLIGLSGAGKTTLAKEVMAQVKSKINNVVLIDGDAVRAAFGNDLGHTIEDRKKNADRICNLCKFLDNQGIHVVCAILSIFPESRDWNRRELNAYFEVFVDTPFERLVEIDYKGLYKRALNGELTDVAGVDLEFVPPSSPDLTISNCGSKDTFLSHAQTLAQIILDAGYQ